MKDRRQLFLALLFAACGPRGGESTPSQVGTAPARAAEPAAATATPTASEAARPTAEEARAFLERVNTDLKKLWMARDRASWVNQNFITEDTDALAADAEVATAAYVSRAVREAARFEGLKLPDA